jgi:hypothetical protein
VDDPGVSIPEPHPARWYLVLFQIQEHASEERSLGTYRRQGRVLSHSLIDLFFCFFRRPLALAHDDLLMFFFVTFLLNPVTSFMSSLLFG